MEATPPWWTSQAKLEGKTKEISINDEDPRRVVTIGADLAPEREAELMDFLRRNTNVFAWTLADIAGIDRAIIEHRLNVDLTKKPRKQKLRKMATEQQEAAKTEVGKLLDANVIREVIHTDWLANTILVKKANRKWRMCVDFTDLNKACPKDDFPVARIDQIVNSTAGCEMLSFIDAYSGYHPVLMATEDEAKTSFIMPNGTYCYIRMPFGLRNAGATFAQLIELIFKTQLGRNMEAYMDDIVVKCQHEPDHLQHLDETFSNLQKVGFRLNPEKCVFGVRSGKLLSFLVSHQGIKANPEKI